MTLEDICLVGGGSWPTLVLMVATLQRVSDADDLGGGVMVTLGPVLHWVMKDMGSLNGCATRPSLEAEETRLSPGCWGKAAAVYTRMVDCC